jgi:hypothetical protein
MTTINVFVHRREPDGKRSPVRTQQLTIVTTTDPHAHTSSGQDADDDRTLAERVFMFLDQRSA